MTGFREVRYPKEDAAYARFAELLSMTGGEARAVNGSAPL